MPSPVTNKFLSSLSIQSRQALLARGVAVPLPLGLRFYEAEQTPSYVYFITSGMASIVMMTKDRRTGEILVVGHEGLVGSWALLGPVMGPFSAFMQMEGTGIRVPMEDVEAAFQRRGAVYSQVLEYTQVQMLTISALAGCNLMHQAEARLARWLLTANDRTGRSAPSITHEFIARMLGVRRTTISRVAAGLEARGIISTSRGRIEVLNRSGLEAMACDCYPVTRRLYEGLYLNQAKPLLTTNGTGAWSG